MYAFMLLLRLQLGTLTTIFQSVRSPWPISLFSVNELSTRGGEISEVANINNCTVYQFTNQLWFDYEDAVASDVIQ